MMTPDDQTYPTTGILVTESWSGRRYQAVIVIGETPKRYRIRGAVGPLLLPSRRLKEDGIALVPKDAVRIDPKVDRG